MPVRYCLDCHEPLEGRSDQKFCSPYCKSAYHYKKNKEQGQTIFRKIDDQIKLNRKLLKNYNRSGKSTIYKDKLLKEGFDPRYSIIPIPGRLKTVMNIIFVMNMDTEK